MAFLVLLSTISFTMEKHYCGDTLIDVAIFSKVDSCCDMDATAITAVEKKSCCKEEIAVVKGQDNLKKATFDDLSFDQQVFLTTLYYSYLNLFEGLPEQVIPHKGYSPPNLVTDIQVLDQVFII
ncbi:hypothetical protein ESZ48_06990 [Gelidibacter gilvus]|uniref:Uncharacterized protein n=2 Tax=Gelidibacter gilvus TaxID=59602 RepID=A0A4Q0XKB9_9FLAO|nr:hypothetical protein ESZ48_06990 [Gelidibacter gilvus]